MQRQCRQLSVATDCQGEWSRQTRAAWTWLCQFSRKPDQLFLSPREISQCPGHLLLPRRGRRFPPGRATTPPKPAVKGSIAGINAGWLFLLPLSSGDWGGLFCLLMMLWAFMSSGDDIVEKPWNKPACNNFLHEPCYSQEPPMRA